MVAQSARHIQPYSAYERQLFGTPIGNKKPFVGKKSDTQVSVLDTLQEIEAIAKDCNDQTKKLANYLKANTLGQTLRNIFDFLYTHVQYVQDSEIHEQVRTPNRLLTEQQGDCDCYTATIACILTNLGIPFYLKMTDYGMIDDFGQPIGYQHVYIAVPNSGSKDYIIDVVLDNFDEEAAGIYRAFYYTMNGAAPRKTQQASASLAGGKSLGEPLSATAVVGIVSGIISIGSSLIGGYNAGVENDRALNASLDEKIFSETDANHEEIYPRLANGEGNLVMEQIKTLRATGRLSGLNGGLGLALNLPRQVQPDFYNESNSLTEFIEQAGLALNSVHKQWGSFGEDLNNRWANVVTRSWIWAYRMRIALRKEIAKGLQEAGELSEFEGMQLVNFGWNIAPPYPTGVSLVNRHGTQLYAENKNADAFVRKPTYTESQLKSASKTKNNVAASPVNAEKKGSNQKTDNTNSNSSGANPPSEQDFFAKTWETPTGKAAIVATSVVGVGLVVLLVKAII